MMQGDKVYAALVHTEDNMEPKTSRIFYTALVTQVTV
jgi:hypothetical protein